MQVKRLVDPGEMDLLLDLSRQEDHPYFYRFSYKIGRGFFAHRIKKDSFSVARERSQFHSIEIDFDSALGKGVSRIDKAKRKLRELAHAR